MLTTHAYITPCSSCQEFAQVEGRALLSHGIKEVDNAGRAFRSLFRAGEEPRKSLGKLLKGEKGKQISECSRKCLPTCLRGGQGAPGLGPITLRGDLVVFKDGFRDRKYCLTECTTVCAFSFGGGEATTSPAAVGK